MSLPTELLEQLKSLKVAARKFQLMPSEQKQKTLHQLAEDILSHEEQILEANAQDLESLSADKPSAFRDRLALNKSRIEHMAISLRQVANLHDPVGELVAEKTLDNGLNLQQVRAPFGVIFMIFESRPNVILEAFSLAFKSGNAIILRGGSESKHTAAVIYKVMRKALKTTGFDYSTFVAIEDYDRSIVKNLLQKKTLIDIVVPRGGEQLIEFVQTNAMMPIIKNDRGLCHTYVDSEADLEMAVNIVNNAKTQRPGVCNALETVLVHRKVAGEFIPKLYEVTDQVGLQWFVDNKTFEILKGKSRVAKATSQSWDTEYLDLKINCRVVDSLEQAMEHIEYYGSRHSEAIVTESEQKAQKFQNTVDAAAVYWNASTRFTDGFEFGLGGELGISTQKLHVRGPVGLRELTTPRWVITGKGQIRE